MNKLWVNKYRPKYLNDIIGHKNQINEIKNWINNLKSTKSQAIIITGNHGIGKSLTTKLIFEELNYLIRIIHPNEIKDHRIYDDFHDYYNHNNSIYSKFKLNNEDKKNLVLIFEEIENITLTSEKKYIIEIFKENNKKKSFPLIFISNNQHSKLLNDLKKNCEEIRFFSPSSLEIRILIKSISTQEKFIIKDNDEIYDKIINYSQFDIRRLINILQELSFHYKDINDVKNLDNFFEKSRKKNVDVGLYEATGKLLNEYLDHESIFKLYFFFHLI